MNSGRLDVVQQHFDHAGKLQPQCQTLVYNLKVFSDKLKGLDVMSDRFYVGWED